MPDKLNHMHMSQRLLQGRRVLRRRIVGSAASDATVADPCDGKQYTSGLPYLPRFVEGNRLRSQRERFGGIRPLRSWVSCL